MEASCLALEYKEGIWTRVPLLVPEDLQEITREYPDYAHVSDLGDGWARVWALSELILTVEINGDEYELLVGRFFKWQRGPLTRRRQKRLHDTMPRIIQVRENFSRDGTVYFTPEPEALQAWYDQAFAPAAV